jgi:hypothetical protein
MFAMLSGKPAKNRNIYNIMAQQNAKSKAAKVNPI